MYGCTTRQVPCVKIDSSQHQGLHCQMLVVQHCFEQWSVVLTIHHLCIGSSSYQLHIHTRENTLQMLLVQNVYISHGMYARCMASYADSHKGCLGHAVLQIGVGSMGQQENNTCLRSTFTGQVKSCAVIIIFIADSHLCKTTILFH